MNILKMDKDKWVLFDDFLKETMKKGYSEKEALDIFRFCIGCRFDPDSFEELKSRVKAGKTEPEITKQINEFEEGCNLLASLEKKYEFDFVQLVDFKKSALAGLN